jgi:NAD(P)H-hydrate epimerase
VILEKKPNINIPEFWLKRFPWAKREGNKYSRGHAVIIGGGIECTGAARLSANAALASLRSGAGLVSVMCDEGSLPVYAATVPASIMTKPVEKLAELLSDERINAALIGPGAGVNDKTKENVLDILAAGKKTVLDADALTVFKDNPEELFQAIKSSSGDVVLTPHDGEFRRLFVADGSKIEMAQKAAQQSGAIVLLKGADTVIANMEGKIVVNSNAPATLATAGSGDVLAGIILGLLAEGMDGFDAACAGAWIHGEAANKFGVGLISEDLPNKIPEVLQDLEKL